MSRFVLPCLSVLFLGACEGGRTGRTNARPLAPRLYGPDTVVLGERAEFGVSVYDPDGGELRVFVAWGDGDTTDYGEFVRSGRSVMFFHAYSGEGVFTIRARCQDAGTLFSDWSEGRSVTVIGSGHNCLTSACPSRQF